MPKVIEIRYLNFGKMLYRLSFSMDIVCIQGSSLISFPEVKEKSALIIPKAVLVVNCELFDSCGNEFD